MKKLLIILLFFTLYGCASNTTKIENEAHVNTYESSLEAKSCFNKISKMNSIESCKMNVSENNKPLKKEESAILGWARILIWAGIYEAVLF